MVINVPQSCFQQYLKDAINLWIKFAPEKNNDRCLAYDDGRRLNDTEVETAKLPKSATDAKTLGDNQAYDKQKGIKLSSC